MYLQIGNDMMVKKSTIIGIFDMDNTSVSRRTKLFLKKAQQEGAIIPCDDLPKSYILAREYGMDRVYESVLSSATLEKRMK